MLATIELIHTVWYIFGITVCLFVCLFVYETINQIETILTRQAIMMSILFCFCSPLSSTSVSSSTAATFAAAAVAQSRRPVNDHNHHRVETMPSGDEAAVDREPLRRELSYAELTGIGLQKAPVGKRASFFVTGQGIRPEHIQAKLEGASYDVTNATSRRQFEILIFQNP